MSEISPLKSLISQKIFENVTNHRNSAIEGEVIIRRSEAEFGYAILLIASSVETVARTIFTPIVCVPMIVQSVPEREMYWNRVVTPMSQGILHNGVIALFSLIALVMNPMSDNLDFAEIGRVIRLIPYDGDD